ncbi:MAG: hypothetical protein ROZ09_15850 [Thiobacillus sp.]|jgi:hypothetical protein|uniref:hypothetical protein n=1 Tax=Thiobacillus sp. TaxID=924 RepID=UPI0028941986|nr:hypothetical protein [Thiobacillus sp.]MDT3708292.1 hypothetical protein [Thiobacillus sp.]
MTEVKRRRKKDGPRTEVFAMRLDPKLKYLAEIAARKQRRSLANFIEWAVEQALGKVMLGDGQGGRSVIDEAARLWDLEPSDRFLKLAENFPDLMTYEEQLIWKAIHQIRARESYEDGGRTKFWSYSFFVDESENKQIHPIFVRKCWPTLVAYSTGQASEEDLRDDLIKTQSIPF